MGIMRSTSLRIECTSSQENNEVRSSQHYVMRLSYKRLLKTNKAEWIKAADLANSITDANNGSRIAVRLIIPTGILRESSE